MRLLNAGCGFDTEGTDFLDLYPSRKGVIKCDLSNERFPFEDNTFDEIKAFSVLEHIPNQGHFLSECYRTLRTGGILRIRTDYCGFLGFSLFNDHGIAQAPGQGEHDNHYQLYSKGNIANLLKRYNLKADKIELSNKTTNSRHLPIRLIKIALSVVLPSTTMEHIDATAHKEW